jgi:protein-disulfide isomerase
MTRRFLLLATIALALAPAAAAQNVADTEAARRFAKAYLTYVPGSTYDLKVDFNGATPNGPYQVVTVVRTGPNNDKYPEQVAMVLDGAARMLTAGMVAPVPPTNPPFDAAANLPYFVEMILPQLVKQMFTAPARVRWSGVPSRPTAIVPLALDVGTGYGWAHMPLAITADGRYVMLGGLWSLDRDPRAQRREVIDPALVQWDPGHESAPVKVVEFSDYECPACKRGWSELKPVLASFGESVRHGMVNFPLTSSHPWAFRAASAGSCVFLQAPAKLLAFKDEMYRQQDTLTVATVDDAALGFLEQHDLDKAQFQACHMNDRKGEVMDRILLQMDLGHRLGVFGTPAYYVNGELLQARPDLAKKRIRAILDAGGKPEDAADVEPEKPAPTAAARPAAAQPK